MVTDFILFLAPGFLSAGLQYLTFTQLLMIGRSDFEVPLLTSVLFFLFLILGHLLRVNGKEATYKLLTLIGLMAGLIIFLFNIVTPFSYTYTIVFFILLFFMHYLLGRIEKKVFSTINSDLSYSRFRLFQFPSALLGILLCWQNIFFFLFAAIVIFVFLFLKEKKADTLFNDPSVWSKKIDHQEVLLGVVWAGYSFWLYTFFSNSMSPTLVDIEIYISAGFFISFTYAIIYKRLKPSIVTPVLCATVLIYLSETKIFVILLNSLLSYVPNAHSGNNLIYYGLYKFGIMFVMYSPVLWILKAFNHYQYRKEKTWFVSIWTGFLAGTILAYSFLLINYDLNTTFLYFMAGLLIVALYFTKPVGLLTKLILSGLFVSLSVSPYIRSSLNLTPLILNTYNFNYELKNNLLDVVVLKQSFFRGKVWTLFKDEKNEDYAALGGYMTRFSSISNLKSGELAAKALNHGDQNILILGLGNNIRLRSVFYSQARNKSSQITVIDKFAPFFSTPIQQFFTDLYPEIYHSPAVNFIQSDITYFLKVNDTKYDFVLWNLTNPSFIDSFYLYTDEFSSLLSSKISNDGTLVFPYHDKYLLCTFGKYFKYSGEISYPKERSSSLALTNNPNRFFIRYDDKKKKSVCEKITIHSKMGIIKDVIATKIFQFENINGVDAPYTIWPANILSYTSKQSDLIYYSEADKQWLENFLRNVNKEFLMVDSVLNSSQSSHFSETIYQLLSPRGQKSAQLINAARLFKAKYPNINLIQKYYNTQEMLIAAYGDLCQINDRPLTILTPESSALSQILLSSAAFTPCLKNKKIKWINQVNASPLFDQTLPLIREFPKVTEYLKGFEHVLKTAKTIHLFKVENSNLQYFNELESLLRSQGFPIKVHQQASEDLSKLTPSNQDLYLITEPNGMIAEQLQQGRFAKVFKIIFYADLMEPLKYKNALLLYFYNQEIENGSGSCQFKDEFKQAYQGSPDFHALYLYISLLRIFKQIQYDKISAKFVDGDNQQFFISDSEIRNCRGELKPTIKKSKFNPYLYN